jgi:uncharacterized HAD superfamily protein
MVGMIKIGLDIDGVVYDWHDSVYRYCTQFKGCTDSEHVFWTKTWWEMPKEEQSYLISLPTLYNDYIPEQRHIDSLNALASLGELFYVTSRPPEFSFATLKFFESYKLPFKENIIHDNDKATVCRLLGIDYFCDDFPEHVLSTSKITKSYLMCRTHNIGKRGDFNTVTSLNNFYEEICYDTKRLNRPVD